MEKQTIARNSMPAAARRPVISGPEANPLLGLQRQAGNAAVARLVETTVQRGPKQDKAQVSHSHLADFLDDLQVAKGALDMSLDVMLGQPLTSEEMRALLLIRRAQPLSAPISVVNTADARVAEIDKEVAAADTSARKAASDVAELQVKRRRARGQARQLIGLQVDKLQGQAVALAKRRKALLAERVKLTRGQRLGTIGRGAPAGTGQITYAGIQVIDAQGRRVALEFAETSASEHAEERIVTRLRSMFAKDQLRGARLVVVTDQVVCSGRCRPALVAFAQEYGLASVESRLFVRSRIGRPGNASPRTTMRTATQPSSAGLPVTEQIEQIYQRPPTSQGGKPGGTASTVTGRTPKPGGTVVDDPATTATRRTTPVNEPAIPVGVRMRSTVIEAGGNLLVDLVLDLLVAKYQQWRNETKLRDRLAALQPEVARAKIQALHDVLADPWSGGVKGQFYNVYLEITSTTTTAIGGGRAVVIPGSPRPRLLAVKISGQDDNRLLSESDAAKVPGLREGATGAVVQVSNRQLVVYSEPVQ
jgi:hypothetical protein